MHGLDYPITYESTNCDEEIVVEHEDVRALHLNPHFVNIIEIVLQSRGWLRDDIEEYLFCPDCCDPKTP